MNAQRSTDEHERRHARFGSLLSESRKLQSRTTELRRALHRHPELGLRLPRTQRAVLDELSDLPLEVTRGETTSGITAILHGARPGPTVLLRGDMDALPLDEDSGLEFSSEVGGAMHACGHDAHVAMLAAAARVLAANADQLSGSVVFMFQPGEEGSHGAHHMISEGVLDAAGQRATHAFGVHMHSTKPSGQVLTRSGPLLAAADQFTVRVTGSGGHGSAPHEARDPIPAAAEMVGALQPIITRRLSAFEPAVLSVTRISAGTTSNIIPETAELEGTIRTLSQASRSLLLTELTRVCESVGAAHGCTVDVRIDTGYPPTITDEAAAVRTLELAGDVLGAGYSVALDEPILGAEDFSYVLEQVPGSFAFLGACPPGIDPETGPANHSNRVIFDEDALAHGVAMYAAYALDALG